MNTLSHTSKSSGLRASQPHTPTQWTSWSCPSRPCPVANRWRRRASLSDRGLRGSLRGTRYRLRCRASVASGPRCMSRRLRSPSHLRARNRRPTCRVRYETRDNGRQMFLVQASDDSHRQRWGIAGRPLLNRNPAYQPRYRGSATQRCFRCASGSSRRWREWGRPNLTDAEALLPYQTHRALRARGRDERSGNGD